VLLARREAGPFLDPLHVPFPPRLFDFLVVLIAHADNSLKTNNESKQKRIPTITREKPLSNAPGWCLVGV
jgi:hypothetical protein